MRKEAKNEYREFSEKKKDVKREHRRERYKYMSQENKQRLKDDQSNYHKATK